jgi:SRSO17 transposase
MICRALDAGVPAAWVTDDEVYGNSPGLRAELEARQIGYVLAVACDHHVRFGGTSHRVDELLKRVPARAGQCVSAGAGAKGHRYYDWAFLRLDHHGPAPAGQAGRHWLMVRRNRTTGELAFTTAGHPAPPRWPSWSRSPGGVGGVEERIQTGKGLCGLDQHQVRRWRSWYRWATLAMLAHAFLVIAALAERTRHPASPGLIPVTATRSGTCSPPCSHSRW